MKKVSGSLKLTYSQYRELQAFSQFGSDLDKDTKDRLALGERVVEVLKQGRNSPLTVEHQVLIIYAVTNGFLKDIPLNMVQEFQDELFEYVDSTHPEIGASIRDTKDLKDENKAAMNEAIGEFVKKFLAEKV